MNVFTELSAWLNQAGLAGTSETDIVSDYATVASRLDFRLLALKCLFATRLQGGAIRGGDCAFLATRAEHPNTQAWGRRKDVKVFGCSDDWR
jgi:hypothetical protein